MASWTASKDKDRQKKPHGNEVGHRRRSEPTRGRLQPTLTARGSPHSPGPHEGLVGPLWTTGPRFDQPRGAAGLQENGGGCGRGGGLWTRMGPHQVVLEVHEGWQGEAGNSRRSENQGSDGLRKLYVYWASERASLVTLDIIGSSCIEIRTISRSVVENLALQ